MELQLQKGLSKEDMKFIIDKLFDSVLMKYRLFKPVIVKRIDEMGYMDLVMANEALKELKVFLNEKVKE